ncbi:Gap-Pol polyprotein, partial [Schistosoma japonicum]
GVFTCSTNSERACTENFRSVRLLCRSRRSRRTISICKNINKVIAKYGSLFTDDGEAYGYCDKVTHEIPVNSRKKTTFHTRRIPVHLETE